ncbi:FluG family protein [Aspergillus foveolatus]|uniref:FluG family protein n=1 Tax=Aspergillus foveolatus TaxID=210207 RepID=UPI003CCD9D55
MQWDDFFAKNQVNYVWVQCTSYIGTSLVRMLPVARFVELTQHDDNLSVPNGVLYLLPQDHIAGGGCPTGSFCLKPDLTSLQLRPDSEGTRAVVMPWWVDQDGRPIGQCARSKLQSLTDQVQWQSGSSEPGPRVFRAANLDYSWYSMTPDDEKHLGLLEEVVDRLSAAGIVVQQVHAERRPGQWEFVLPPDHRLRAVDRLVIARQAIRSIVSKYGLRATLHPRPFPEFPGTGAHVHLSLYSTTQDGRQTEPFFAGILQHFPAVSAFALPHELSYRHVAPGITRGGVDCAWGWDNREVLLRRIAVNRFEVKMMDGLANPYLALSALLAAGLDGLLRQTPLTGARQQPTRIPTSLQESLSALEQSAPMRQYLSDPIVDTYLAVKKGELEEFQNTTAEEVHDWIISRF